MPRAPFRRVDRTETLRWQLDELIGFAYRVPTLIEDYRQKRWDNLEATTDGADDDDLLALFEQESGSEEGYGHADFSRTCLAASVVFAWDVFFACLVKETVESTRRGHSRDQKRNAFRKIGSLGLLKKEWLRSNRDLEGIDGWGEIDEVRCLRNALVHNGGRYTPKYLSTAAARRRKDIEREFGRSLADEDLIDLYEIPLDREYVRQRLQRMLSVFREARSQLISS